MKIFLLVLVVFSYWRNVVVDPSSDFYYRWLMIISLATLYNLTIIIARSLLPFLQEEHVVLWLTLDYICDFVYLLDMAVQAKSSMLDG